MSIQLSTPAVGDLADVVRALRDWQSEAAPIQLHPGDLGWFWQYGPDAMAAAVRTWTRDGQLVAMGFLDGPVFRMTVAPGVWRDEELAQQVVADVSVPQRGILPPGKVSVETPDGSRVQDLFAEVGWSAGESWTPLRRNLADAVPPSGLRIEVIESGQQAEFTALHRAAWGSQRFTDGLWRAMAAGLPFSDALCLLGYDDQGVAVAGVTVWSAGAGKPGLLEPVGVHVQHRGRGYGRTICLAAAAELKRRGSSSALVCTRSANAAAVATYRSAGFRRLPERLDRSRDA